ncbi:hypothetical protein [uncultured Shimia sp.]|uniref:hypothetical protein n=1 Tax=uncultured Shimia sp. TaxID=573152 RepID=UPI002628A017|nr:hypothetical protein [uncultured Shimia sp.]
MPDALTHKNRGRNPKTLVGLAVYLGLLAFLYSVGTLEWIILGLALFAVPAAIDLLRNPITDFELTDTQVHWKNGGQEADLPLSRIQHARFDTRWDFSVRVTLILIDQSKLRIPQDVAPPHEALEKGFKDRGIKTERHHFRVI